MDSSQIMKRTARDHIIKRCGSNETYSSISIEDYNLLTSKPRRSPSDSTVGDEEKLRYSVAQVEALTFASQDNMRKLREEFTKANKCPEVYNQVKNTTTFIKSTSDFTPLDVDDDPKAISRYREQPSPERHLSYLRSSQLVVEIETTKPTHIENLNVSSAIAPFSYASDETSAEKSESSTHSFYIESNRPTHPYFTRSRCSVHSQTKTNGSERTHFTRQESNHSNHSDSNKSETNNNNNNNLDNTENDFSIHA